MAEDAGAGVISIAHGDCALDVLPALGGSLASTRFQGLELLRLAPGTTFGNGSRGAILPADRRFNRAG